MSLWLITHLTRWSPPKLAIISQSRHETELRKKPIEIIMQKLKYEHLHLNRQFAWWKAILVSSERREIPKLDSKRHDVIFNINNKLLLGFFCCCFNLKPHVPFYSLDVETHVRNANVSLCLLIERQTLFKVDVMEQTRRVMQRCWHLQPQTWI